MICRDCGALLHIGLRHQCTEPTTMEEGLRRVRRAQRARATFAAADLGDPIQAPPWLTEWPAPQKPIRVTATVGRAIACRVTGCTLHVPERLEAIP